MKKVLLVMAFLFATLFTRAQSYVLPYPFNYVNYQELYSFDNQSYYNIFYYGMSSDTLNYAYQYYPWRMWTDQAIQFGAMDSSKPSHNLMTRLVGADNSGILHAYDISALPKQTLSISNHTLTISGGNFVTTPDNQTLSVSSGSLTISGGNTVSLPTATVIALTQTMTTKAFNTAYQVSSTRPTRIWVNSTIACALTLTTGADGSTFLEISANGTTGWITVGEIDGSNTGTLSIGINTTQKTGGQMTTDLPAGYYWRLRTNNNTGTPTYTWNSGNYSTF